MSKAIGKVVVAETNKGVSELVVSALALPIAETQVLDELNQSSDPRVRSLGSVVTDEFGAFEIDYDPPHLQSDSNSEAGYWALVVGVCAPEPYADGGANQLLSRTRPRANPGSVESYVIRVPAARLQAVGMDRGPRERALLKSNPLASAEAREILEDMAARHRPKTTFAERYAERRARKTEEERARGLRRRPPFTFDIATPADVSIRFEALSEQGNRTLRQLLADMSQSLKEHINFGFLLPHMGLASVLETSRRPPEGERESLIEFDKKHLVLRDGSGGKSVRFPLEDVVVRTTSTRAEEMTRGVGIRITDLNGTLLFELPRIPNRLTAEEREPSKLYRWYSNSHLTELHDMDAAATSTESEDTENVNDGK